MNDVIRRAIEAAGGPAKVASALQVSVQAVCFWRDGQRRMPVEYMAALEELGAYAVRRWGMRPDDWHVIWPELKNAPEAPLPVAEPESSSAT